MMEPEPCQDSWRTPKPTSSSESASRLALFPASASGATTPASSQIHAPAGGSSSVSPHPGAPILSATDPSPSHPTWSAAPLLSSPPLKSRPQLAELHQLNGSSSITSDAPVASPASSAPPRKHCELQQNPSGVPEDLLRFFRKLAALFPEPTDEEMSSIGLIPKRKLHVR